MLLAESYGPGGRRVLLVSIRAGVRVTMTTDSTLSWEQLAAVLASGVIPALDGARHDRKG